MNDPGRITRPAGTIPYADSDRFRGSFGVRSDTNPETYYTVSYDTASGCWVCSCKGGINYGRCKHLTRYGRSPTRADIKEAQDSTEKAIVNRLRAKRGSAPIPAGAPVPRVGSAVTEAARRARAVLDARPIPVIAFEPAPAGAAPLKLPASLANAPPLRRLRGEGEV